MLQYELIASYFGLFHLHLDSKYIIRDWDCLFSCFALAFFFLEDTVRKLSEYCGTASPLHVGTKQDGTTEGAHKMTGQISFEKKVPNSLRWFPYSENVNESHNEMWDTTVAKLVSMLAAGNDMALLYPKWLYEIPQSLGKEGNDPGKYTAWISINPCL